MGTVGCSAPCDASDPGLHQRANLRQLPLALLANCHAAVVAKNGT
jgi:hypothetical protein